MNIDIDIVPVFGTGLVLLRLWFAIGRRLVQWILIVIRLLPVSLIWRISTCIDRWRWMWILTQRDLIARIIDISRLIEMRSLTIGNHPGMISHRLLSIVHTTSSMQICK